MNETTAVTVIDTTQPMKLPELKRQVNEIQHVMKEVMKDREHYGTIPGCGDKPTLLQPGAQKLALTFGFASEYVVAQTTGPREHREYDVRCKLTMRSTGAFVGEGVGCASTMESKFRFRSQATPTGEQIPNDYQQNKGHYAAKGLKAQKINGNWEWCKVEKVEHDNPADYYNTILKMAKKRAYVDAVLTATAASDIFTQDIEDDPALYGAPSGAPAASGDQAGTSKTSPTGTNTTGPANATRPAPSSAAAKDGISFNGTSGTFIPDEIKEVKSGTGKNGDWCLYELTFKDGPKVRTFDQALVDIASQCGADEQHVYIEWEKDEKYKTLNLKTLTKGASEPDEPAAGPATTPGGTLNACIVSVEDPKETSIGGVKCTAWAIVTDAERVGTFDARVADGCAAYAGTGELMALRYGLLNGEHKVIQSVQCADQPWK